MIRFPFDTDDIATALRAVFGHMEALAPAWMILVVDDTHDFWDHVTTALHHYPVADLHPQALDLVHVVQSGAAYGCSSDEHWLQCGHGRQLSGSPHLHQYILNLRSA